MGPSHRAAPRDQEVAIECGRLVVGMMVGMHHVCVGVGGNELFLARGALV